MVPDYSDRKIKVAELYSLKRHFFPTEATIGSSVRIFMSSLDGTDYGPNITIELAIPDEPSRSVESVEADLLAAASAILKRIASDPATADLAELVRSTRERDRSPERT